MDEPPKRGHLIHGKNISTELGLKYLDSVSYQVLVHVQSAFKSMPLNRTFLKS